MAETRADAAQTRAECCTTGHRCRLLFYSTHISYHVVQGREPVERNRDAVTRVANTTVVNT